MKLITSPNAEQMHYVLRHRRRSTNWIINIFLLKFHISTCHGLADAGSQAGGCHGQLVDDRLQTNRGDVSELFLLSNHVVAEVVYYGLHLRVFYLKFKY